MTIPARGGDCHHIEVQMMQLCQNLQVVTVYNLRSTIYFYRAQFIACIADGIYGGQVCVCVGGGGYIWVAEIPRRKLTSGRRGNLSAAFRYVFRYCSPLNRKPLLANKPLTFYQKWTFYLIEKNPQGIVIVGYHFTFR